MRKRLVAMALTLLITAGCAPEIETPTLEDMGIIGVMGFDYVDGHRMKVTVSMPMPTQGAKEKTQVFTAISKLPSESLISLSTKTERTMVFSQLRVVLVGEELARKSGLQKIVIDLYRNPAVGDNVFIAVVKQTAEEVISGKYPDKPEINSYLNNLLRPRRETAFEPFTTLHDYIFTSTNEVSDPSLPYLEKRGGEIVVSNVAVFKGHKMIGKLTEREGKIVQTILGRNMLPKMSFMIKEKSGKKATIVFDFVRSHSKVKSNGNLHRLHGRERPGELERIKDHSPSARVCHGRGNA